MKNYLRKVYDKLGVADRLELALYCLHNRVLEGKAVAAAAGAGTGSTSTSAGAPESPIVPPTTETVS